MYCIPANRPGILHFVQGNEPMSREIWVSVQGFEWQRLAGMVLLIYDESNIQTNNLKL